MANPSIKWQQVAQGVEVHVGQIPPVIVGASSINAGLTLNDFRVYCCPRPQGSPGGGAGHAGVTGKLSVARHGNSACSQSAAGTKGWVNNGYVSQVRGKINR